jgi:DNA helicase-2/ATP-dependent DNA helicase PcrA
VTAPLLEGDALRAVEHRGSHLQIIAAAGSGKTEVVSQRVAHLLANEEEPRSIVAFTFTERAAAELKDRIARRVEEQLGRSALDQLSGLYVGTIHAYCFRLLQQVVPRYETYDVLDDNQLTAFLSREAKRLEIRSLDPNGRLFAAIRQFLQSVDVVENELLDPAAMPDPFGTVLREYLDTLERYRLLTYGQQIARTVHELERPEVAAAVHGQLRHLIVDEYQDVNPAQERLVELLTGPDVELCVVGDDDQAIYQWRGSDVSNIVTFRNRFAKVATFEITTNRRSRPQIITAANEFAQSIPGRLPKSMHTFRPAAGPQPQVVLWSGEDEPEEAGYITQMVLDLHEDHEVPFRDIAVLVRSRAVYPELLGAFATFGVPVQPGGRSGLFDQPEARVLGRAVCWLTGVEWADGPGPRIAVQEDDLLDEFARAFVLDQRGRRDVRDLLRQWQIVANAGKRPADLISDLYQLLDVARVRDWDLSDELAVNRLGTLARFSALLADYESVRRRARADADNEGEQVGGQDRGTWYYRNLGIHIVNYAVGAYEGFDGEQDLSLDAVDVTTVHRAKGLEWPVVFVPSLTARRFPSSMTGRAQPWLVPRMAFNADRYEGSDADERRLFYVALTRGRDFVSVSRHERTAKQRATASPYYLELDHLEVAADAVVPPVIDIGSGASEETLRITYSELAQFLDCGHAYRLRTMLGFQPPLAPELGYGKAVHHVMRTIAEQTKATGAIPTQAQLDALLEADFFLPTANKVAHRQMKDAARRLVSEYVSDHPDDLYRTWETERPFELHLDDMVVSGRADVILDQEGGVPTALAILDYKTSTGADDDHGLQLQVYADAGRREGLEVRGAYVHDLKASARTTIDVSSEAVATAERQVLAAGERLRRREFDPNPGDRCRRCDVRTVCGAAK